MTLTKSVPSQLSLAVNIESISLIVQQSIAQLLQSAGLAVRTLTAIKSSSGTASANRREDFTSATDTYLKALHSVDSRLKRQIKSLDDAGVIRAEPEPEEEGEKAKPGLEGRSNTVDVGWLNTRSNKVGRDMEAELWAKARVFLEGMAEKSDQNDTSTHDDHDAGMGGDSDKDMMDVL